MKKSRKQYVGRLTANHILSVLMVILMAFPIVSCDNDEPEDKDDNEPSAALVTATELAGEWTLVKDNVLYSKENSSKQDEVISYSGNSYPKYHFYNVTVSEDDIISFAEVSASGSVIGNSIQLELDGNDLKTVDGKVAGTIQHFDKSHAWDNLRIEWNKDYSPISFNAPVISTYMLQ